jgi:hypothetical protein
VDESPPPVVTEIGKTKKQQKAVRGGTIMANTNTQNQELQHLHHEGAKALILNIVFFVVLFAGILLVPVIGFGFSAIAIAATFVVSMLYIYLT